MEDLESQSKRHLGSSIIVKKYLFSDSCCFFPDTFMYMMKLFIPLLPYVPYCFPYFSSIVPQLHPILLSAPRPLSRGLLAMNILLIVSFEIHLTSHVLLLFGEITLKKRRRALSIRWMNSYALKFDFSLTIKSSEDAWQFQFHMTRASLHASRMKRQQSCRILSSLHMIWRIAEIGVTRISPRKGNEICKHC